MGKLGYTSSVSDDPVIFQLHGRRVELQLNQREAAELIGTKQSTLSSWERGVVEPSHRSVQRWAKALGMRVIAVRVARSTERPPRGGSGGTPSANGSV